MVNFDMKKSIESSIVALVENIDGKAKFYGERSNICYEGTPESAGEILWGHAPTAEMVFAAKSSGAIEALFSLAREAGVELSDKVKALEEWAFVINPS